ncbi:MAG: flagellar hook-associated protein FlgK [Clostridiales bacterium]|jgi:flagellar hook-associated protein 1 FlgK|nr:flagellar hook-associated protein FlgK [Clostridiales bacterium]
MRSSFFELHVAVTGIMTSRAALETVSHNTANAATKGYSRQIANIRATTPLSLYSGRGMVGTGSEVYSVTQVRDVYLDRKYWNTSATLGEYSTKRTQLRLNETILQEMEGTGLTTQFNRFFNVMQDLVTNSGDVTFRTNVVMQADSLTAFFKDTYDAFLKQQSDINDEVRAMVSIINSIGVQIHTLNEKIRISEAVGDHANDLRDQRALLVDELSKYVNVDAYEEDKGFADKRYYVKINGQDFVMNNNLRQLYCAERRLEPGAANSADHAYRNADDKDGLFDIFWGDPNGGHIWGDTVFDIYSPTLTGELKGLIDVRDGNGAQFAKLTGDNILYQTNAAGARTLRINKNLIVPPDLASSGYMTVRNGNGELSEVQYASWSMDDQGTPNDHADDEVVFVLAGKPADLDRKLANVAGNAEAYVHIGPTSEYKGIPYYLSRLNNLVRTFASSMNFGEDTDGSALNGVIGHVDGYNLKGEHGDDPGEPTLFFTYMRPDGTYVHAYDHAPGSWDYLNIKGNNFVLNDIILDDPDMMNAAEYETAGVDDNRVILSMLRINQDNKLFKEGRLQDFIIGMTTELGIDVKEATNFELNYNSLTVQTDNHRMSVSGVDINEEMTNMMRFNQQFVAASRLINVIDDIYSTLVNRLGVL